MEDVIDIAVVNSYLLHKEVATDPMSHYEFRESIVRGICLIPNFDIPKYGRGGRPLTKSVSIDHRMIKMSLVRQCVYCMTTTKETSHNKAVQRMSGTSLFSKT